MNSRPFTRSPRRPLFAERALRNIWPRSRRSLRLDVGRPDHLAPFLGFVGDEFPEFSGGHKCRLEAHVEEAHLHRGSATIALISLLSRSTMLVGVFFGAPIPCQPLAS